MIYNVIRAITSYIITLQIDVPTMCFFQQYIETRSDLYLKPFQHFISVDSLFGYIMVGKALTVFNLFFEATNILYFFGNRYYNYIKKLYYMYADCTYINLYYFNITKYIVS